MKAETEAWYIYPMAVRVTWLLKLIPFIRWVCVSGSLSKGVMEEDSDIDFFIIVQKNRLWMVRAIFSFLIFSCFGVLDDLSHQSLIAYGKFKVAALLDVSTILVQILFFTIFLWLTDISTASLLFSSLIFSQNNLISSGKGFIE